MIQKEGQGFISYCQGLFVQENNAESAFYKLREEFNATNDLRKKAALFVYLNRHCFNGLCRYNSKGGFNVPFGRYSKPTLPEKEMLYFHEKSKYAVSRWLISQQQWKKQNQVMLYIAVRRMFLYQQLLAL